MCLIGGDDKVITELLSKVYLPLVRVLKPEIIELEELKGGGDKFKYVQQYFNYSRNNNKYLEDIFLKHFILKQNIQYYCDNIIRYTKLEGKIRAEKKKTGDLLDKTKKGSAPTATIASDLRSCPRRTSLF
jgi:hypothetical protein